MGGKSRKTGGISFKLIQKIAQQNTAGKNRGSKKIKPNKHTPLFGETPSAEDTS